MSSKFTLNLKDETLSNIANDINKVEEKSSFAFANIDIDLIVPNKNNFFEIEEEGIEKLAKDIQENGLYHNLVVRLLDDGRYELISGERRYRALKKIGSVKVPCQIKDVDSLTSDEMLIQANWSARELTDYEKMTCVQKLNEIIELKKKNGDNLQGKKKDVIGKTLGMSSAQTQRYISISKKLIPELKDLLSKQQITLSDSFDFSQLNEEQQKGIYEFLKNTEKVSKEEIQQLKTQITKKDEKISKSEEEKKALELEKEELFKKINSLENTLSLKNNELQNVNNNIENIKNKLEEDISKKIEKENEKEREDLQAKLKNLETQKKAIENELSEIETQKNKEIEILNSNKEKTISNNENIKANITLEMLTKAFNDNINDILKLSQELNSISDDNKTNLKQLKNKLDKFSNFISKV